VLHDKGRADALDVLDPHLDFLLRAP